MLIYCKKTSNIKIRIFTEKSLNLKCVKSSFGNLTWSTAPINLLKPPIDLKMVLICSGWPLVNLLVYGQLFSVLNLLIAMLLDLRWNPPPPPLTSKKNTNLSRVKARLKTQLAIWRKKTDYIFNVDIIVKLIRHTN